jgi:hypothetical protein
MTVVYVATPAGFRVGDAISVPPSVNAIDPVGVVRPATPVTVKVKVTGLAEVRRVEARRYAAITTGALVTTCDTAAETADR